MSQNRRKPGCWFLVPFLLILCAVFVYGIYRRLPHTPKHVYIDGYDILATDDKRLDVGGGLATYDPSANTLRLTGVDLATNLEYGIQSDRQLTLAIDGSCRISALDAAIYVKGDLHCTGSGTLALSGGVYGIETKGALYMDGAVDAAVSGCDAALRYKGSLTCRDGYTLYEGSEIRAQNALETYNGQPSICMAAPCMVSFDTWGGESLEPVYFARESSISTLPTPTRAGYSFVGWCRDENLTDMLVLPQDAEASMKLYARWEKKCSEKLYGIDVSSHQGTIDWAAVAADGIDFAMIRAGFRSYGESGTLNPDSNFDVNAQAALQAGLEIGAYYYSQAVTVQEAKEEAAALIAAMDGYDITLPCAIDFEFASDENGHTGRLYQAQLTTDQAMRICLEFCQSLREAGYTPMVYASGSMLQDLLDWDALAQEVLIWMADWEVQTAYNGSYDFWQCSETGTVSGISGSVDMDVWYRSIGSVVSARDTRSTGSY